MVGVQRGAGGNREDESLNQDLELPPVELPFEHARHTGSKSADYGSLFQMHHRALSSSSAPGEDETLFPMSSSMPASPFTTTTTLTYFSNSNSSSSQPTVPSSSMPSTPTNLAFTSPSLSSSSSSSQYHSHPHPQLPSAHAPPPISTPMSVKRDVYGNGSGVANAPSPGAISFSSMHITSRFSTPKMAPAGLTDEDEDPSNILDDKSGVLGKRKSSLQMDVDSS